MDVLGGAGGGGGGGGGGGVEGMSWTINLFSFEKCLRLKIEK